MTDVQVGSDGALTSLPGTQSYRRCQRAATVVLCCAFFFADIRDRDGSRLISFRQQNLENTLFVLLAVPFVSARFDATRRTLRFLWFALMIAIPGFWLYGDDGPGSESAYAGHALLYVLYGTLAACYVYLFYDQRIFLHVFYVVGRLASWVALGGFLIGSVTSYGYLVSHPTFGGSVRLNGTLSEPSAWAPAVAALLFLAVRRKCYFDAGLFALVALLTRSPTVIVTLLLTCLTLALLRRGSWAPKLTLVILVAGVAPLVLSLADSSTTQQFLNSGSAQGVAIGRTLSGLEFLKTGGTSGQNDRAAGTSEVVDELTSHRWEWTGRGLGSSDVYFPAKVNDIRAYSLPVTILFDLGIPGLCAYVVLLLAGMFQLRNQLSITIFLPFAVSTCINSAEGLQLYKFVLIAVLVGLNSPRRTTASGPFTPA